MKKILFLLIAVLSVVGVNAQTATFDYDTSFKAISSLGVNKKTLASSDSKVSMEVYYISPVNFKGVGKKDPDMLLKVKANNDNIVQFTFNLDSEDKVIKKVIITCDKPSCFAESTFNYTTSEISSYVSGDFNFVIENLGADVKTIVLKTNILEQIRVSKVEVQYGVNDIVELSDDVEYPYLNQDFFVTKVSYKRNLNGYKWGTLCLPFDYVIDDLKFMVYSMTWRESVGGINNITLTKLANGNLIKAGTPVIFYCDNSQLCVESTNVQLTTVPYVNGVSSITSKTLNNCSFTTYGTIEKKTMNSGFYIAKDILYETTGKVINIKPYRAWVSSFGSEVPAQIRNMKLSVDDAIEATEVSALEIFEQIEESSIYDINGAYIDHMKKGVNLVKTANGVKKIFVK